MNCRRVWWLWNAAMQKLAIVVNNCVVAPRMLCSRIHKKFIVYALQVTRALWLLPINRRNSPCLRYCRCCCCLMESAAPVARRSLHASLPVGWCELQPKAPRASHGVDPPRLRLGRPKLPLHRKPNVPRDFGLVHKYDGHKDAGLTWVTCWNWRIIMLEKLYAAWVTKIWIWNIRERAAENYKTSMSLSSPFGFLWRFKDAEKKDDTIRSASCVHC